MKMIVYNNDLDADERISAEECIAAAIFDWDLDTEDNSYSCLSEEDCAELGRRILRGVLMRFAPQYFEEVEV